MRENGIISPMLDYNKPSKSYSSDASSDLVSAIYMVLTILLTAGIVWGVFFNFGLPV